VDVFNYLEPKLNEPEGVLAVFALTILPAPVGGRPRPSQFERAGFCAALPCPTGKPYQYTEWIQNGLVNSVTWRLRSFRSAQ